ncbi:DUF7115 domain-containing protein [Halobacterium jilantaiense]|uniref:DUF7115 domain-containing protein n=1 Tax=Halobacterium jilantaiense TaxID=355548 RepID=A0A1I0QKB0_9EURY|nr:hypothetical protein [Halobacterium jilantaiense]SEW27576.1 hypothetical protein SAMN04487945_2687 [Halobacterium jilantaiense]
MDVPALVQSSLGDEDVAAHVALKGEDALFVTPTRTLLYTADGLLSDESVDEFPHDAEGIGVSEGRRKAKVTLDYGLDGDESFSVPSASLDDVLHPILAGVLNAADVTDPGETVKRTYRFSELTLVVTSDRVVKHIGSAVWGPDYEEIAYATVTGIDTEDGNVSSQLVLETTARTERIKAPNEQFRAVREAVQDAVFAYHGVDSAAELSAASAGDASQTNTGEVSFGGGVDPIDTSGVGEDDDADAGSEREAAAGGGGSASAVSAQAASEDASAEGDEFESSGFRTAAEKVEPPVDPEELEVELDEMADVIESLADTVERQQEVIEAQQAAIEAQRERLDALRELTPDQ